MKEHKRIQRISGMLLKGDSLDYAALSVLKQIPQEPAKVEVAEYREEEGVKGIILSLPALEDVLSPQFPKCHFSSLTPWQTLQDNSCSHTFFKFALQRISQAYQKAF